MTNKQPSVKLGNVTGSTIVTGSVGGNITNVMNEAKSANEFDFVRLAQELLILREALQKEADTDEKMIAIGNITQAKQSADKKDFSETLKYLSGIGKWALSIAEKIGIPLALEAIKKAMLL